MSERGSWITEYIYCDKCVEKANKVLMDHEAPGYFMVTRLLRNNWPGPLPILAGLIRCGWSGEEIYDWENTYGPALSKVICHPIQIGILPEQRKGATNLIIYPACPHGPNTHMECKTCKGDKL